MPGFNAPPASGFNAGVASGFNALGDFAPTVAIYLLRYDEPSGRHEVVKVKDGAVLWTYTLPFAANDSNMAFGLSTDHTPDLASISVGPQGVLAIVDTSVRRDGEAHMQWEVHLIDRDTGQQLLSYSHTDSSDRQLYRGPCEIDVDHANGTIFVLSGGVLYKLSSTLSLLQDVGPNQPRTSAHAFLYANRERYLIGHDMRLNQFGEPVVVGAHGGTFSQWGFARAFYPDLLDTRNGDTALTNQDFTRFWPADGVTNRGGQGSFAAFFDSETSIRGWSSATGEFRPLTHEYAGQNTPRLSAIPFPASWPSATPPSFLPRLHTMGTRCFWQSQVVMLGSTGSGQSTRQTIAGVASIFQPVDQQQLYLWEFLPEDATPRLSASDAAIPSSFLSDYYDNLYIHGRRSDGERFIACVKPSDTPTHIWSVLASDSAMQGKLSDAIHWILDVPGMGNSMYGQWPTS